MHNVLSYVTCSRSDSPLFSSFEVVQVIHEKLLDMVGKVQ